MTNQTTEEKFDEPPEKAPSSESAEMGFFAPGEPVKTGATSKVEAARRKHERKLLAIDGVEGVAVESDEIGEDSLVVFVRDDSVAGRIPKALEGFPVRIEVTGEFDAFESVNDTPETGSRAPKKKSKKKRKSSSKDKP